MSKFYIVIHWVLYEGEEVVFCANTIGECKAFIEKQPKYLSSRGREGFDISECDASANTVTEVTAND